MVYVDDQQNQFGRMLMCHMIADTEEELHAMAAAIGLRREWYQLLSYPHYDLSKTRKAAAIERGAKQITGREAVRLIRSKRAQVA